VELRIFTLDEIDLTDAFNGEPLDDIFLDVEAQITIYVSGYNTTGGGKYYTGPVSVDWTQTPDTIGTFSNATGTSTIFTAGSSGGATQINGENTALDVSDNFALTINDPTLDYIEIKNATNNLGVEVDTDTFTLGGVVTTTYYCAGYNDTVGYIGDVSADWTLDTAIGNVNPAAGDSTSFTATSVGTGVLTATVSGITDTVTITVEAGADVTAPAAPTGASVTVVTEGEALTITWTANTEPDLAGYNIFRSTSSTSGFTQINSVLLTDTTYTDSGLTADTTYYYYIVAVDNATVPNISDASTTVSGTAAAVPDDGDGDDDDGEFPWIILVIIIIVIVVLLLLFLMMKKKPAEEAVPPEEVKEEMPPEAGEGEAEEEVEVVEEEEIPPPEDETKPAEDEGEVKPPEEEEKPPEEQTPSSE
jgi:hypothetical protein